MTRAAGLASSVNPNRVGKTVKKELLLTECPAFPGKAPLRPVYLI